MGVALIKWIQAWSHPVLDYFFICVSFLGTEEFFLLAVPLIYWLYAKRLGFALGVLFCSSAFLNDFLKNLFALPRPPVTEVRVLYATSGTGYGFPSGHAQHGAAFWGLLAAAQRSRSFTWAVGVLVALIGFSRLYLGLHFLADVLGGLAIGTALLLLFLRLGAGGGCVAETGADGRTVAPQYFLLGSLFALLFYHAEVALKATGALVGMGLGFWLEEAHLNFAPQAGARQQAAKALLGIGVLAIIYLAGKRLLPAWPAVTFGRYLVLGFGGFFAVPWLFRRLGWG